MKDVGRERNKASGRNAVDRERTKMRERQRRSITTNIFHGLRKHGGYRLSPRADINEVLRHLAQEAGWTVEHDGTTFRSATSTLQGAVSCPVCGGGIKSTPATPSCSGDADSAVKTLPSSVLVPKEETLLSIYMSAAAPPQNARASEAGGGSGSTVYGEGQQQQLYVLHETIMSNHNTPAEAS